MHYLKIRVTKKVLKCLNFGFVLFMNPAYKSQKSIWRTVFSVIFWANFNLNSIFVLKESAAPNTSRSKIVIGTTTASYATNVTLRWWAVAFWPMQWTYYVPTAAETKRRLLIHKLLSSSNMETNKLKRILR